MYNRYRVHTHLRHKPSTSEKINTCCPEFRASLVAQRLKHLPVMQETWVWSLGWEFPLEMEMSTHSSILAWRIPWTEEPGGLQSMGSQRVGHDSANSAIKSVTTRIDDCIFFFLLTDPSVVWTINLNLTEFKPDDFYKSLLDMVGEGDKRAA